MSNTTYSFVNYLWDSNHAATLDPVARLIYRSNLLGSDQRITNTGGGNTSAKLTEIDPLTGKPTEVLWVKGSGGDLRTSKRENFSSLYQDKLLGLQEIYGAAKDKGPKTAIEDAMVEGYLHCTFNLNPRAPSIDTPLHSFVPLQARRPYAPQRGHRHRRVEELRRADEKNLWRRSHLDAVAATRF